MVNTKLTIILKNGVVYVVNFNANGAGRLISWGRTGAKGEIVGRDVGWGGWGCKKSVSFRWGFRCFFRRE